jgi:hypothetical protein
VSAPDRPDINCIVNAYRLNRFMSTPRWRDEMWEEAEDVLEGLESQLAGKLNSPITPIPFAETVAILGSGQVDTTYPVASVTTINGTTVAAGALPAGWRMQQHRLFADSASSMSSPFTLAGFSGGFGLVGRSAGVGSATVEYMAGWGPAPALRLAILKKARTIMNNQHDDTLITRDTDGNSPPPLPPEEWTDAEMKDLEIFRNIPTWR